MSYRETPFLLSSRNRMDLESIPGAISRLRALEAYHPKSKHFEQEMYHLLMTGLEKLAASYIGKGNFRVAYNRDTNAYRLTTVKGLSFGLGLSALLSNRMLSISKLEAPRALICSSELEEVYVPQKELENLLADVIKLKT